MPSGLRPPRLYHPVHQAVTQSRANLLSVRTSQSAQVELSAAAAPRHARSREMNHSASSSASSSARLLVSQDPNTRRLTFHAWSGPK